jgi:REP element-mobilizing transposase RayT
MHPRFPVRHHVPHREVPGASVFITWRLHRAQIPLAGLERGAVLEIVKGSDPEFASVVAAVAMDDHIHVLVTPNEGVRARQLVLAWKGISAHRLCGPGLRRPPLWQRAYFDRWLDEARGKEACVRYILDDPRRRWPSVTGYEWVYEKGP